MTASVHVLVVAPTPAIAETVTSRLVSLRANVTLVTSFNAARQGLCESTPDLLISEVRLGEFNGLHLALRARSKGIRAIVLGDNDQVTQREAAALGADYLPGDSDAEQFATAVQTATMAPKGRFGRHRIHAA